MPRKIEDYALIGDLQTAALVGKNGSIDWLCLPDFSSPACFCALLGSKDNGSWRIAPTAKIKRVTRRYRPGTLILETTFETRAGSVLVTDFMPVRGDHPDIVRIVRGLKGRVQMQSEFALMFDYGNSTPWYTPMRRMLRAISGPHMVILRAPTMRLPRGPRPLNRFAVEAGQVVPFVLTYGASHLPLPKHISWRRALSSTQKYWEQWSSLSLCRGSYKSMIDRSLITLKALTFRPTGGIVAAPTTSLPEKLKGARNWDYRYCWLRDATFTLIALLTAGYRDEARAWRDWLLRALAGNANQVQIMYGIRGERDISEWEISWLKGYQGARPVRIGNAAFAQFQLDVFGEVLGAMYHGLALARQAGHVPSRARRQTTLALMENLLHHLEKVWRLPDQGMWEMRSAPRHFCYSKVMAWVAFDCAVKFARLRRAANLPIAHWERMRDRIHREICRKGFNKKMNSFVQFYGSNMLDASLLFIPLVGFLPVTDPRVAGTIDAIEKNLLKDGFVQRYKTSAVDDSLPPGEGVFLACSFWLVQVRKLQGRDAEAKELFEQLAKLANDVGLLSEEYDPSARRLVGNFPQALSHVALINAAFALEEQESPEMLKMRRTRLPRGHRASAR